MALHNPGNRLHLNFHFLGVVARARNFVNGFDHSILTYLNSFANRYPHIDALIVHVQHNNLIKGGFLIALWWYSWFSNIEPSNAERSARNTNRLRLIAGMLAMIAGLVIARILAQVLPFRIRPFANPELHFVIPDANGTALNLATWSSFPSDHAVVWFCVVTCLYFVNRPLGLASAIYVLLLCLGRIYAGIHHPTDILFGALIGVTSVCIFSAEPIKRKLLTPILVWSETQPGWFYLCAFLCTYEISNMFDEIRAIAPLAWNALKLVL
jgi:undecaprenyl-diphosphatase